LPRGRVAAQEGEAAGLVEIAPPDELGEVGSIRRAGELDGEELRDPALLQAARLAAERMSPLELDALSAVCDAGMESISVRIPAAASSTRSMALSGRKRSLM